MDGRTETKPKGLSEVGEWLDICYNGLHISISKVNYRIAEG